MSHQPDNIFAGTRGRRRLLVVERVEMPNKKA
jgi:hypothetical protein